MMKYFALGIVMIAALAMVNGCISTTMYGCETTETLAQGASEGDVIMKHGAPDNIIYLGTTYFNPTTGEQGEIDKYLFEYRIGGGTTLLGTLFAGDEFKNICYLIENGTVMGGGYVGEGSGSILLGGELLHPKARAGYGGDGHPTGNAALGAAASGESPGLLGLGIGPF